MKIMNSVNEYTLYVKWIKYINNIDDNKRRIEIIFL